MYQLHDWTPPDQMPYGIFAMLAELCLWGNQADQALKAIGMGHPKDAGHQLFDTIKSKKDNIWVDDTKPVWDRIMGGTIKHVSWIPDNVGRELTADLLMIFWLLHGFVDEVLLHLKAYPTFISDATMEDFEATLVALEQVEEPVPMLKDMVS